MQIRTTVRSTIHLLECLKLKRFAIASICMREPELSYTAGGNVKWYDYFGKQEFLKKSSDMI